MSDNKLTAIQAVQKSARWYPLSFECILSDPLQSLLDGTFWTQINKLNEFGESEWRVVIDSIVQQP